MVLSLYSLTDSFTCFFFDVPVRGVGDSALVSWIWFGWVAGLLSLQHNLTFLPGARLLVRALCRYMFHQSLISAESSVVKMLKRKRRQRDGES